MLLRGEGVEIFSYIYCEFAKVFIMKIGLNFKQEDGYQAVSYKVIKVFVDENIYSYVIPLGRVVCTPG